MTASKQVPRPLRANDEMDPMSTGSHNYAEGLSLATILLASLAAGCNPPTAASSHEPAAAVSPDREPEEPAPGAPGAVSAQPDLPDREAAARETAGAESAPPTAAPKVNRPPRADRLPSRPGDAEKITFDDLNLQMPANVVFRPYMVTNERVKELEGQRVSISGFMHGAAAGLKGVDEFVLLKNTECKFGQDGQADHLARVFLKGGTKANYTRSDIKIEGTLRIEPFTGPDGNTWSIYNIEDAQIR